MGVSKKKIINVYLICAIMLIFLVLCSTMQVVANQPPVADAQPDTQTVYVGEEAWFNGSSSYDSDGYIASYFWDFEVGVSSMGENITYIYSEPGDYTVTLTVTDNESATDTDTVIVTVMPPPVNEPPVANAEPKNQSVYVGEEALFRGNESYDTDGDIISYYWDFGDGTSESGENISHVYSVYGNYSVNLTVTDNKGATDTDTVSVWVRELPSENKPPVANAELENQTVYVGHKVWLNGNGSYDPDGDIVSYHWNLGDGNSANGQYITHVFLAPGNFTVTLTITDNEGGVDNYTIEVTVIELEGEPGEGNQTPPSLKNLDGWGILVIVLATGILTVFAAVYITETGKYALYLLILPLYTKLKKKKILDNFTRGKIYGYILANPGDHYNSIKKALNLSNGLFAYHLRVLEKEKFIKSKRDGTHKRFYPFTMKVPSKDNSLRSSQIFIIDKIKEMPGISQKDIAALLGVSSATINYHIKELIDLGIIRAERGGMRLKYYYNSDIEEVENKARLKRRLEQMQKKRMIDTG